MWELKGPAFERVFAYGLRNTQGLPEKDREFVVRAHVREWARSVTTPVKKHIDAHRVNVEWIKEGERIVGVKVYV